MQIDIQGNRTVGEVQQDFHAFFPYLKIHFYNARYSSGKLTGASKQYAAKTPLSVIIKKKSANQCMSFTPACTVAEFEQHLYDEYGLCVQVLRSSGNSWIQTSLTDSWTLEQQNQEGHELSIPNKEENPDLADRDKWE